MVEMSAKFQLALKTHVSGDLASAVEYMNMFIVASIAATVFWGGWMALHIGGWEGLTISLKIIKKQS